jgi:hypothetical protein
MTPVYYFPIKYTLQYSYCIVLSFNYIFQNLLLLLSEGGSASEADIS